MAAALPDPSEDGKQIPLTECFGHMETGGKGCRAQTRKLRLECGPDRIGKTLGRLHHHVQHKTPPANPRFGISTFEFGDRGFDPDPGRPCHMRTPVQGPIHGRKAKPCLQGDFLERKRWSHEGTLR